MNAPGTITPRRPRLRLAPALACGALLASGCAVFAPKDRTEPVVEKDARFSLYAGNDAPRSTNAWWLAFDAPELNALMTEALTNNPSIQQAWARLKQADAFARRAGSARWPWLNYGGNAARAKNSITHTGIDAYSLGLNASYELDLWGRIKSQAEAAEMDRQASREQVESVALTLSSQIALRWTALIAQRKQTAVLRRQLAANRTSLELIELRFRQSLASALDVYQQRQAVAATEALIPPSELRETLLRNELAALLGRPDVASVDVAETNLPALGPTPPAGLPADLLAHRPDVRAAGLRLQSADWLVSSARAARLPAIRLTADAAYRNGNLSDLFDDWYANLAAGLAGPVFEGGRRKAEVARARAVAEERLASYRETVIRSVREVEDALAGEKKQREYLVALDRQTDLARRSYDESIHRYRNGLIDYTTVLLQLNSRQTLERRQIEARYNLTAARINLLRALGGQTNPAPNPPTRP